MKRKKLFIILFLISFIFIISGCGKSDKIEENVGKNIKNNAYPPLIMVDNKLYQDTGFISSLLRCGNSDGEIYSSVSVSEKPSKNNESNFGKGYAYQFSSDGIIDLEINNDWFIFRETNFKEKNDIPYVANFRGVAYFDGEVVENAADSDGLLLKITNIPDDFLWIF